MDLDARTLETLDWPVVLDRLASHCRTLRAARTARGLDLAGDLDTVRARYAGVRQLRALLEDGQTLPISAVTDIEEALERASHGAVLEPAELAGVARCLTALEALRLWIQARGEQAPALALLVEHIRLDPMLVEELAESFDERGQLSELRYPDIGELRRRILGFHSRIRETLDRLLKGRELEGVLQDKFVTQRGDRYVLPIRAEARRKGLGIVHDTSKSGETVFVEPGEVVELNNKLRLAESEQRRLVQRILTVLSSLLARHVDAVRVALECAVQVDLAQARHLLGEELGGHEPLLGQQGVIALKQVRHPVLVLRGLDVVANDLRLDASAAGLILSGPNTGGKTVALKSLGLAALMVRAGIPVPAAEGSRVDLFTDVLADIGDLQSVEGDLSTFSGHLLVLNGLLSRRGPGVLILLDEVAVGTDPSQGAALARAVLEELVEAGCRVAVTTHYTDLKAFAATDARFRNAAVHLVEGRPSYEVEADAVGLSHALSTARRLGMDGAIVDRAEACLDEEQRRVGSLLEDLEEQRVQALRTVAELEAQKERLQKRERQLELAWEKIRGKSAKLAEDEAARSLARLRQTEERVVGLIASLQRDPSLRRAGSTLDQIRQAAETVKPRQEPVEAPPPPRPIRVGDRVRIGSMGKSGEVVSAPRKGRVEVDIKGLKTRVKLTDCVLLDAGKGPPSPQRPKPSVRPVQHEGIGDVRTERNTCDLRGQRADEALDTLELFMDRLVMAGEPVAWVLHGHGGGALKQAVRRYLPKAPHAKAWRPADTDEGGDAFTRVEL
jgi:DNA mismatch repair protein MutS2